MAIELTEQLRKAIFHDPYDMAARHAFIDAMIDAGEADFAAHLARRLQEPERRDSYMIRLYGGDFGYPAITVTESCGWVYQVACSGPALAAHAKELFTRFPITEVRIVPGLTTVFIAIETEEERYWPCYPMSTEALVRELYELFDTSARVNLCATHEEATAVMSRWCVAYGRHCAGLPCLALLPARRESHPFWQTYAPSKR